MRNWNILEGFPCPSVTIPLNIDNRSYYRAFYNRPPRVSESGTPFFYSFSPLSTLRKYVVSPPSVLGTSVDPDSLGDTRLSHILKLMDLSHMLHILGSHFYIFDILPPSIVKLSFSLQSLGKFRIVDA